MPVTEAEEFFGAGEARTPAAHKILDRLADVGLGYLSLGQPLTTLSGGERQRLKLATHMAREGRRLRPRRADHRPAPRRRRAAARPARPARRLRQVGHRHRAPPGGHGARRLDHRPRPRRRPRRRPDRLRGHTRRPRRRPLHPHRRAPRGLRRHVTVVIRTMFVLSLRAGTGAIELGSDRGSPNHGSTLLSKRVMAQIRSPVRVRT